MGPEPNPYAPSFCLDIVGSGTGRYRAARVALVNISLNCGGAELFQLANRGLVVESRAYAKRIFVWDRPKTLPSGGKVGSHVV